MSPLRGRAASTPLDGVDVLLADLDGVVYKGADAIPYAVDALNGAADAGVRVAYITNNASRSDAVVAGHLSEYGLRVVPEDVVTSPQAAMTLLRGLVPDGALLLVVGGEGLVTEVEKAGYRVTPKASDGPDAVVQGFAPDVSWRELAEASFALARDSDGGGIPWVATNTDWTIPVAGGIAPGNGTLVSAVHTAVGILPQVAGKPEKAIFDEAVKRFSARSPLFIGDRLDTDILGASRAGIPSVHVLTGIDRAKQLLAADKTMRPNYILEDLRQLSEPYPETVHKRGATTVGRARVGIRSNRVEIDSEGDRPIDLLRAACAAIWESGIPIYALDVPERLYARR
ncbi:HAD-IIA family hydrolase [Herbiconiux sp. L3-i23]|uniref:HAD-IIA family hydrolase n=1 Tax=Herbiconiux sp. L3-i23 TaxID=2905871 RepID=UPI00205A90E2|nr:HAD-IIA family hydrolase [Herbiconiux sp. L3-i23]BDI22256.1 haloacid dehalogenase [Herbiconiux sp. L3-i23]